MSNVLDRPDLYERDFVAWSEEQAALLRAGRVREADLSRIAEELEDMGRSQRQQLRSRLEVLLLHLLKWEHQPRRRSRGWQATIVEQRIRIQELLEDSPSLATRLDEIFPKAYRAAIRRASAETGLPESAFPATSPRALPEILGDG